MLRIVRKGGQASTAPLNPITVRALDAYLADDHPTTGPLFLDRTNSNRLAYTTAYDMIQRLARTAGIPAAASITPHSLRHTFITEALAQGSPCRTCRTPPATPTPAPPGATTTGATTSIAIPPTSWPDTSNGTPKTDSEQPSTTPRSTRPFGTNKRAGTSWTRALSCGPGVVRRGLPGLDGLSVPRR